MSKKRAAIILTNVLTSTVLLIFYQEAFAYLLTLRKHSGS